MNRRNTNVFLTGVTGLIGRHVLYELLKKNIEGKHNGKIYLLIRSNKDQTARERLDDLLSHKFLPSYLEKFDLNFLTSFTECIEGDLCEPTLRKQILEKIDKKEKINIIHSAATTNLFHNEESKQSVIDINYNGSKNLMNAFKDYDTKFTYISTAFSCGVREGIIENEYLDTPNDKFRNPYEMYKIKFERELRDQCIEKGIEYQILRPSIVCGRLMDHNLYFTSKFDVIYGLAKFFYRLNQKGINDKFRIFLNKEANLNVISVDYVAKVICEVFLSDIKELNIVHSKSVNCESLISKLIESVGYTNYEFVDDKPLDLTRREKSYYTTAGLVFEQYLGAPQNEYDTNVLIQNTKHLSQPLIEENINNIIDFAIEHDFVDIG